MEKLENNKIMYYLLQILSYIATLIILVLVINIVHYFIHLKKYYRIVYFIIYFMGWGIIDIFIRYYFTNFYYKNKCLYLLIIILGIIFLSQILLRLP